MTFCFLWKRKLGLKAVELWALGRRAGFVPSSRHHTALPAVEPCLGRTGLRDQKYASDEDAGSRLATSCVTFLGSGLLAARLRGMDQAEDLRALFLFSHSLYPQWLLEAYRHTTWPQIDVLKKEKTGKRMTLFFPFSVLTIRWSLGGFASTKGKSSGSVTAVELFELRTSAPGYSHAFYVGD